PVLHLRQSQKEGSRLPIRQGLRRRQGVVGGLGGEKQMDPLSRGRLGRVVLLRVLLRLLLRHLPLVGGIVVAQGAGGGVDEGAVVQNGAAAGDPQQRDGLCVVETPGQAEVAADHIQGEKYVAAPLDGVNAVAVPLLVGGGLVLQVEAQV